MLTAENLQGAVFDVDDTLIRTVNLDSPAFSLHELARLQALHEAGEHFGLPALSAITPQQNLDAFLTAPAHTIAAAIWSALHMAQVVPSPVLDPSDALLLHILERKNELYGPVLRAEGKEIPGASAFVRRLGQLGLHNHLSIASSAIRRDIDIVIELLGIEPYFPDERITSVESVTHPKPHPECFDRGFRSLDLPDVVRPFVLAIDDSPRGVASAKAAGLYTCALTTWIAADQFMQDGLRPDIIASGYDELDSMIGLSRALALRA